MEERFDKLISKYWKGELSSSEREELERLLVSYPGEWIKSGMLHKTKFELQPLLSRKDSEAIADKVLEKCSHISEPDGERKKSTSIFRRYRYWLLAPGGIVMVFLMLRIRLHQESKQSWERVSTVNGMKTNLKLDDGTQVWLNAGSTLKYPETFKKRAREVYLTGEAFFDVTHQAGRPFMVHTARIDAKVLGTQLDIRAYPGENFSQASLLSGAVKVIIKEGHSKKSIELKPRQKIIIKEKSGQKKPNPDLQTILSGTTDSPSGRLDKEIILEPIKEINEKISKETAWKQNVLIYEDESFEDLARRLDRWYGVHIIIMDSTLAKQRFTGRADNISLEKLLYILKMLKPFTYILDGDRVIIKKEK